jgi:hypothetical protein
VNADDKHILLVYAVDKDAAYAEVRPTADETVELGHEYEELHRHKLALPKLPRMPQRK